MAVLAKEKKYISYTIDTSVMPRFRDYYSSPRYNKKSLMGIVVDSTALTFVISLAKLGSCAIRDGGPHSYVSRVVLRCPVCDNILYTINNGTQPLTGAGRSTYQTKIAGIEGTEHRFLNNKKRSQKFYVLTHPGCTETLTLNPLAYMEKLQGDAAIFSNEDIRL